MDEVGGFMLEARGIELRLWGEGANAWSLYSIKGSRYGLAACNETRRAHFSYELHFRGEPLNLKASSTTVAWDEAQQSLIRRFHERCVAGTSDPINVVIVLVDENGRVAFFRRQCRG